MLAEGRDVLATLMLEKRLSQLRERYVVRTLEGERPGSGYWEQGEEAIFDEIKRVFYSDAVRALVKPSVAADLTAAEDFATRSPKVAEQATVWTHRRLASIPFLCDPDFKDI